MKKYFSIAVFLFTVAQLSAQQTKTMAFPITGYIIQAGDSVTIVQVLLPGSISIKEKTVGLLNTVYKKEGDSVFSIGSGRCQLIKNNYYYFGMRTRNLIQKPAEGDLLYTSVIANGLYEGVLFDVIKHGITLNSVYDTIMVDLQTILHIKNAAEEKKHLALLCADVKFTGTEMLKQGSVENVTAASGRFKGQKILDAMQTVTEKDMKDFLRYIFARPSKYAGRTWKISEIMATWMVAGTPTLAE